MPIFVDNRGLLDRFRRGDPAALAEVYYRYVDEVATLARRGFTMESSGHVYVRGCDRDGEREVVQETFAKAFAEKARLAYDGINPYRPYLMRIAKNLMIDRWRARGAPEGAAPAEGEAEPVDLHWAALAAATREYVATLSPDEQQFVQLRFEDELSQDAVAQRLGVTRRRVRSIEGDVAAGLKKFLKSRGLDA